LLGVVLLAIAVNLVIHERAHNIKEPLDGTDAVVCVRVVHGGHLEEGAEEFIVAVTAFQIHVHSFEVSTCQIDGAALGSDRPRIEWHFVRHGYRAPLELPCFDLVNLGAPLIPLKRVESLNPTSAETILRVEVDAEVAFDQRVELPNDLVRVLVKESLQL
jgi:hypothetical protein